MTPSRALATILLAVLVCVGLVLVVRRPGDVPEAEASAGEPAPEAIATRPRSAVSVPVLEQEPTARRRVTSTEEAPPTELEASSRFELTGRVAFDDGSVPPLVLTVRSLTEPTGALHEAGAIPDEGCRNLALAIPDAEGAFAARALCAGRYALSIGGGLAPLDVTCSVPGEPVHVRLGGYLLRVVARDEGDRPIAGARLSGEFIPDAVGESGSPRSRQLHATTDERGECVLRFAERGSVRFRVWSDTLLAEGSIPLAGPSGILSHVMTLRAGRTGDLRLVVRDCERGGLPVTAYCLNLEEPATGERLRRICSEEVDARGAVQGLLAGSYLASLDHRYVGGLDYLLNRGGGRKVRFEVHAGAEATLELCMPLGGRLSVRVDGSGAGSPTEDAEVSVRATDATEWTPLQFRDPDDTGVTVDWSLPLGIERVTHDVLRAGAYELRVEAEGCEPVLESVLVTPGETTPVSVRLAGAPERSR